MDDFQQYPPGLLSVLGINPEDLRRQQQQAGLLSAGLQLLAGSGYSPVRQTTGQLLGQAGMAGVQGMQRAGESAIERALKSMQVQGLQEDLLQKRQQREALQEYFAPRSNVSQALAAGGGPTPAAADRLKKSTPSGSRIDTLKRIASDPRLPVAERQLALKELEITGPKPIQLDQAALLYAIAQGFDIQNLTSAQASDILAKTKELTPDQLIALGRFLRESGLNIPGLTLGGRVTPTAPTTMPSVQPTAQPAAEPTAALKFNPTVQSAPGLTLQQRQELAAKLEEAKPKVISTSVSLFEQLADKRNTAQKLLNDEAALDSISGTLGKLAVESGISTFARDANALLQNIKSRNFVETIQRMRQENVQGAAVGNVAIPEMESLANIPASLIVGQSKAQLKSQLQQVIEGANRTEKALKDALRRDYGNIEIPLVSSAVSTRPPRAKPIPQGAIDELRAKITIDPSLRLKFDEHYGPGSADSILGK